MDEQEFIHRLAVGGHEAVDMLSSHRKAERDQRTCAAFLRCLGITFSPNELVISKIDPPDIIFRDARFEVKIALDRGRKMHADWKREANRRDSAKTLDDLVEPYRSSAAIPFEDVVSLVVTELGEKASHYGFNTCSQPDAILYINLPGKHLYPLSETSVPEELRAQGWTSACFLFVPYSHVLAVTPEPPDFLDQYVGTTRQECQDPGGMFDL